MKQGAFVFRPIFPRPHQSRPRSNKARPRLDRISAGRRFELLAARLMILRPERRSRWTSPQPHSMRRWPVIRWHARAGPVETL